VIGLEGVCSHTVDNLEVVVVESTTVTKWLDGLVAGRGEIIADHDVNAHQALAFGRVDCPGSDLGHQKSMLSELFSGSVENACVVD
jgi:hypothetical protein